MEQVLQAFMSNDDNVRTQAETFFNNSKNQPNELCVSLLEAIIKSPQQEVRSLGLVMLKRVLFSENLWKTLQPMVQSTLKVESLKLVEQDPQGIRHKLCALVGSMGCEIIDNTKTNGQTWPELLPFMLKCTKSPQEGHRESALLIFSDLAALVGRELRPHFEILKEVLAAGLVDAQSLKVRTASLMATANFLQVLDEPAERLYFQQLLPAMLGTISAALNANDEDTAKSALELFIDLAEITPVFFRPHLPMVTGAMLQIAGAADNCDEALRQLAVEFLTTLSETRPQMMRKVPNFIEQLLPVLLNMMMEIEEYDDWNDHDDADDEDETSNAYCGEQALDRFSLALGGKTLITVLMSLMPALLQNPDWKHRHVGLICIGVVGEGSLKYVQPILNDVVKNVSMFLRDSHPRVRWAACNTVGQMSTDFGPDLQIALHTIVMPALLAVMDDQANPRVQSHAAAAIVNFCEDCPKDILILYLEQLLSKLIVMLQGGKRVAQEQAVTAIAAIADCAEDIFRKYYSNFTPFLFQILSAQTGKEYRLLKGKSVECLSLIGVAVGKEMFGADAKKLMEIMLKVQASNPDPDDPQIGFFFQAWGRISSVLGQDFVPYLPYVMPANLAAAKVGPTVKVSDVDGDEEEEEGYDYVPIGDQKIGIKTSALEEKATACQMIFRYAAELKEGFYPYVEEVTKIFVPLMKFGYHDEVRSLAVAIMPHLIVSGVEFLKKSGAAKGADKQWARSLFQFIFPTLMESAEEEWDPELMHNLLESWAQMLVAVDDESLTEEQLRTSLNQLVQIISEVLERRINRNNAKKDQDHDEEEEEAAEESEDRDSAILQAVADVFAKLGKFHQRFFLNNASELFTIFNQMLQPNIGKPIDRQVAICVFDDLIEYMGMPALNALQSWFPMVLGYVADPDPGVKQAAMYGMGSVVQAAGAQLQQYIPTILEKLAQQIAIDRPDQKYGLACDNAISSIGKICQSGLSDNARLLPLWLNYMPIKADDVESKVIYGQLCGFIESSNVQLLGDHMQNLPKIISVFAEALGTKFVDDALTKRILVIFQTLQTKAPQQLQQSFATLPPDQQQKLQLLLSGATR